MQIRHTTSLSTSRPRDFSSRRSPGLLNLTHLRVYATLQVMETPHEMTFLSVLQHLLQIQVNAPSDAAVDVIWETVGKLVAGASMLSGRRTDADRLVTDGTRRLNRAVSAVTRRRAAQCAGTCQCICHDEDASRLDSTGSTSLSPTGCRPSTDTGS